MKKIVDCMVGKRKVTIFEDPDYVSGMSWGSGYELHINGHCYNENDKIFKLLESSFLPYWLYTDFCFPEGDEE